ncbi:MULTISPECIES: serine hydrolase [Asticcacaulis]|uniref:serine hydrolase domain-containing protein n=1 Tax=Asticcacaulis TaxID=76890 RepID=UPI001AE64593|nr:MULTISPECIES: serine hydrolase domain-containing protein [Asticcacaulis]MBP2161252.1 CubicO group peptidase (beta-lactamase class C family) [Asticcacaulis solisilvae]MDR6802382.1 CubicO group peptidase (beta-lactamase class C family) [Asticcacaulis sp. BE141]
MAKIGLSVFCLRCLVLLAACLLPATTAVAQTRDKALTQRLHRIAGQLALPGFSVAIVRDGKIVYRHSEGVTDLNARTPVARDSLFGIASVTKSMTGIIMEQLEREGQIRLDDPLLAYPLDAGWHPPEGIGDPNITLGDVLSMSAGDRPGETYVYNGARFNLLSGVFDRVSQTASPQSYVTQNRQRILRPLGMDDTMAGYQKDSPLAARAVKRYEAQPSAHGWDYVERPYDWDAAYPASGLISTIDDLAKYAAALDGNALVGQSAYDRLTAPRHGHPYGYGWFTQVSHGGLRLHWVFGYGQAESALFLRVPDKKLTFIFLSNADTPSALAQLDYADALRQPFGLAFLDTWVMGGKTIDFDRPVADVAKTLGETPPPMVVEALLNEALMQAYRARMTGEGAERAVQLTELLQRVAPDRFGAPDVYMLRLLSDVSSPGLEAPARRLVAAFDTDKDRRPVVTFWSGNVLEKLGDREGAMASYRKLCDYAGFDDEPMKAQACEQLGRHELATGKVADGRRHLWHSAIMSRHANGWRDYDRKLKLLADTKGLD